MTTKTKSKQVKHDRETIVNDSARTFSDADFPIGSVSHQGDMILVRIDRLPKGSQRENRQLAEGTTQGSRHVLEVGKVFDCDTSAVANAIAKACPKASPIDSNFIGPVFIGGELTHPEHGNQIFADDMIIATVYQRTIDVLNRIERIKD